MAFDESWAPTDPKYSDAFEFGKNVRIALGKLPDITISVKASVKTSIDK